LTERAKRRGIHGILSGAGGDEWLGVTPALAADLVRAGDVRQLARLVRGWRQSYELTPVQVLRCLLWRYSARPLASAALDRMAPGLWKANRVWRSVRSTLPWIAPAPALRRELDARIDRFLPSPRPSTGFYLQDVRASLEHTLTSMELEEIFETGRRLHVRFLHPYWDADVVDILYRTPPLLLFSGGRSKSVVRQIMARRFPGLGLEHQKKRAGTTFYRSVLHREIPALWARRGSLDALGDLGVVEPGQATAMATKSIAENFGTGLVRIWDLVNVESWIRAHQ
jgi:Asparagine synthase